MDLIQQLNWRYATKGFDPAQKLTEEQVASLKTVLQLSPSSFGLQPYKIVRVKSAEMRAKLREVSWGQPQVTDAADLFVLCRRDKIDEHYVEGFIQLSATTRGVEASSFDAYKQMILGFVSGLTPETYAVWADKQVYLALGNLLTSCAVMNIDASPMEGFDASKYDEILELPAKGLHATVICAVGMRSAEDKYAGAKKVRYSQEELFLDL
ncbi:MAG: NAD(P)H-dependent oxidoreductase [Candidatus Gracilibacteria bacterium]